MHVIFKLWLTLSSLLLSLSVYLVKSDLLLDKTAKYIKTENLKCIIENLPAWVSYVSYFLIAIILTLIAVFLVRFLSSEQISKGSITSVETANDAFLPSYLGYFFVALSVNEVGTFIYVFSMIFIFIYTSKISFFNPVFLLFGYKFFYLTDNSGIKTVVITKKELKAPQEVEFINLKRINNYTFISTE